MRVLQNHETTIEMLQDFIEEDGAHQHRYDTDDMSFLLDNLKPHISHLLTQVVEVRQGSAVFTSVPRPPYQPKYGPIVYAFYELVGHLAINVQEY